MSAPMEDLQGYAQDAKDIAQSICGALQCAVDCETQADFTANITEALDAMNGLRDLLLLLQVGKVE